MTNDSQAPVVPIVLGGANYSALAPNHSFIHVDDFNRYIVHSLVQNVKKRTFQPTAYGNLSEPTDL